MLIGYARCSTDTQDLTAQQDGLIALGVKGLFAFEGVVLVGVSLRG